ncbi:beta strand repeat-containing protein [Micromonospora sp. NPDC050417]|uniref:beta strand repeat-containing protein n=1 Tax=Micromonospora sp. NPDC050417 TaxID=3364280 RepID=UPI0037AC90E1
MYGFAITCHLFPRSVVDGYRHTDHARQLSRTGENSVSSVLRRFTTASVAMLVAGLATLGLGTPARAAPGDANARGVVVDLDAEVLGIAVISADATIGTATAPAGGGTDTETLLAVSIPGAVGVTTSGTVEEVTATRAAGSSSAFSSVNGLNLTVLGIDVLDAGEVTATATCPQVGATSADTTLVGLELFGSAVTLVANGPSVDGSAAVVVPGLLGASLNASLTRTETTTAAGATAVTILATLTLTGTVLGVPVTIPVGTVIVAEASCERPPAAPTTASITPDEGPQSGGQTVTITGTGFVPGGTTVTFDGVPATGVAVAPGGTSLTAVTPPGAIGPASVVVSTVNGSAPPLGYTYLADGSAAVVTGLTPTSGPTVGGTTVTITGTGFTGALGVDFNGLPSTGFTIDPAGTTITVVTPPNPAGPAVVELVFPAGTATAPPFTYVAPTITSIVPDTGPNTGGTTVTITGTGFTGATGVTFGDTPGTDLVVDPSGTSLTVVTPPGPVGPVDVTVLIPGADATAPNGFTYVDAAPVAASIAPNSGPQSGGQTVTITGAGFVPGGTTVTFDGVPATGVAVAPGGTSLTAVTPPGAIGPAVVVVTTTGGSSGPLDYTYLADGSAAVVTGLTPTSGPTAGGTTVTITGTGFTGATGVTFDGVPGTGFTIDPAGTTITVVTPPNAAGAAVVELVFPAGTATAPPFTYVAPTITSIVPDTGPNTGGTTVTITGTGFTGATGVTFGDTPGTDLVVDPSGTSLTVVTPPGLPGPVDVTVQLPGDDATAPDGFTYVAAAPVAASIAPNSGPQSGGQTVTITGAGFVPGGTTVTFDGVPATGVAVAPGGTSLTAVTPPGAIGPAVVVVTTTGGSSGPLDYTYLADGSDADVTGLTPTTGPTYGGTTVTITGTGFTGATGVTFDGVPGTGFTIDPAGTTITVVTPPNAAGAAVVELVFPAGTATAPAFTYVAPTIASIVPGTGPNTGGTTVTITGTGFTGATGVTFGDTPGTNVVVDPSGTSLTVVTPPGLPGPVDVTVQLPGDDATAPDGFIYQLAPPVIDTLTPGGGPTGGGTTVTVDGSGFVPGQTVVTICGQTIPASEVTVAADGRSLSFRTPACPAGNTTVLVTTDGGSSNGVTFRYTARILPVTGDTVTAPLTAGAMLVLIGASMVLLTRRRRPAGRIG